MPIIDNYLYFINPCLSLRDIRIALQLVAQYGDRSGFFDILASQRRAFENYPAICLALKDFYGKEKSSQEKSGQAKTSPEAQVKTALKWEEATKGCSQKEKAQIHKTQKLFKGRIL